MLIIMKDDLRVIKSKQSIEKAFLELIEEKGYGNVHLIDIASRARVNRNTIYLHYSSKEEIIESIIIRAYEEEIERLDVNEYLKIKNNRKKIENMFITIFSIIKDKIDLYRILLTDENLTGYVEKLMFNIKKYLMVPLAETSKNEISINYIVFGVYGVIRNWVVYAKGTDKENIDIITELVCRCARSLKFK